MGKNQVADLGKSKIKSIEDHIVKLELKADKMKERAIEYRDKYKAEKERNEYLENEIEKLKRKIPNKSELESLRVTNSKLIIELNSYRRQENKELKVAMAKLHDIQKILNNKN
jgi:chromosome segregation ATPase